jgi:thiol-disulfide isomerase/thioredoxin
MSQSDSLAQKIYPEPETLIGFALPNFSGTALNGNYWYNDFLDGKVTLISFWSIGCMPCMHEIEYLNKLHKKFRTKDFILISFAPHCRDELLGFNDTLPDNTYSLIRSFFNAPCPTYDVIPVCEIGDSMLNNSIHVYNENIQKTFFVHAYPCLFLIDKKGIVRYIKSGFPVSSDKDKKNYTKKINALIKELLRE